jgi:ribosomal protein L35AE/L33A
LTKRAKNKFSVSVTAAQTFVGKFVVFQRLRNTKWVSLKHVTLTTLTHGTKPTEVTSARFTIKLPTKLQIRAVLPAAQAATCYLPAKSKVIRS